MHILLQLGILVQASPLQDPSITPIDGIPASNEQRSAFSWLKIVVLGLRANRRDEYIQSLQQISQTQAARIPREPTVQIPYLARAEYARIPLRQDSLLVVYGAVSDASVDAIFEKIGIDLASFLFFVDMQHPEEIEHIREIRQRLLARYPIPDMIMLADHANLQSAQVREQLALSPQTPLEPVQQLDLKSTYKIVRKLLLKTAATPV
jgi:hypothetical protein